MDKVIRKQIESFAWDCTIGTGQAEEWAEMGHEPGNDELLALEVFLGHKPSPEEQNTFVMAWRRCLQEASQP